MGAYSMGAYSICKSIEKSASALGQPYLGHLHELPLTVFVAQASQTLQVLRALPQSANLSCDHPHVCLGGAAHRADLLLPVRRVSPQPFDEEGERVGEHCRRKTQQRQLESGRLKKISPQPVVLLRQMSVVLNQLKKSKRRRSHQRLKSRSEKQLSLHGQDVLGSISIIADVDQVLNLGDLVGFGVLGSHPERGDAEQLQFAAGERFFGEKEIDELDHEEVGLAHELVLLMHLHQPVQQHAAHVLAQLRLNAPVTFHHTALLRQHETLYFAAVHLLLRQRLHCWLCDSRKRHVRRQVLISYNSLIFFRMRGCVLAKFHSNQQRMNNEQYNRI